MLNRDINKLKKRTNSQNKALDVRIPINLDALQIQQIQHDDIVESNEYKKLQYIGSFKNENTAKQNQHNQQSLLFSDEEQNLEPTIKNESQQQMNSKQKYGQSKLINQQDYVTEEVNMGITVKDKHKQELNAMRVNSFKLVDSNLKKKKYNTGQALNSPKSINDYQQKFVNNAIQSKILHIDAEQESKTSQHLKKIKYLRQLLNCKRMRNNCQQNLRNSSFKIENVRSSISKYNDQKQQTSNKDYNEKIIDNQSSMNQIVNKEEQIMIGDLLQNRKLSCVSKSQFQIKKIQQHRNNRNQNSCLLSPSRISQYSHIIQDYSTQLGENSQESSGSEDSQSYLRKSTFLSNYKQNYNCGNLQIPKAMMYISFDEKSKTQPVSPINFKRNITQKLNSQPQNDTDKRNQQMSKSKQAQEKQRWSYQASNLSGFNHFANLEEQESSFSKCESLNMSKLNIEQNQRTPVTSSKNKDFNSNDGNQQQQHKFYSRSSVLHMNSNKANNYMPFWKQLNCQKNQIGSVDLPVIDQNISSLKMALSSNSSKLSEFIQKNQIAKNIGEFDSFSTQDQCTNYLERLKRDDSKLQISNKQPSKQYKNIQDFCTSQDSFTNQVLKKQVVKENQSKFCLDFQKSMKMLNLSKNQKCNKKEKYQIAHSGQLSPLSPINITQERDNQEINRGGYQEYIIPFPAFEYPIQQNTRQQKQATNKFKQQKQEQSNLQQYTQSSSSDSTINQYVFDNFQQTASIEVEVKLLKEKFLKRKQKSEKKKLQEITIGDISPWV